MESKSSPCGTPHSAPHVSEHLVQSLLEHRQVGAVTAPWAISLCSACPGVLGWALCAWDWACTCTPVSHQDIPAKGPQVPLHNRSPASLCPSERRRAMTLVVPERNEQILTGRYVFPLFLSRREGSRPRSPCRVPAGEPPACPSAGAHNAGIHAALGLLKGLLRGEIFVVLPGEFHKEKTLAMGRGARADI